MRNSDERAATLAVSNCFACGPANPHGLRLKFEQGEDGVMSAAWTPDADYEGYKGIIHGGIVGTVLDEAMAKMVAESGCRALTAELRVRYRRQVPSGETAWVRGWIAKQNRRKIETEAAVTNAAGEELAHGWAVFLELR